MIIEQYKKTILPNGIKIVTEKIPYVESFSLGFWFNVGARDENLKNNGISHFVEHMLFKGTEKRSAKKIATDVETFGGYLNAFTSKEHTCYYGRGLVKHIEKTFDVLSDMIQNSSFKEREIKKEAGVIVDELNDIEDSPEEIIFDRFEECIFKGNSLSLPVIGTEKNILKFDRDELSGYVDKNYGFNNLTIAVSGNVDHESILNLTQKYFTKDLGKKNIKRKNAPVKVCVEQEIDKEIQQVHSIIGRATYGYKDKKRAAVNLLSNILGEGSSSRLFQAVRERNGICYQLNSVLNSYFDVSSFGIYYSTNEKMFAKSQNIILNEFKKLREKKIGETELKRSKEYLKGNMLMSLESMTNRMFRIANSEIYFDRLKTVEESVKEIDEITADDILEISNEILDEKSLSKIIIRSKNGTAKSAA